MREGQPLTAQDIKEQIQQSYQSKTAIRQAKIDLILQSSDLVEKDGAAYRVPTGRDSRPAGIIIYGTGKKALVIDMSDPHKASMWEARFISSPHSQDTYQVTKEAHFIIKDGKQKVLRKYLMKWDGHSWQKVMLTFTDMELLALSYAAFRLRTEDLQASRETLRQLGIISTWKDSPNRMIVMTDEQGRSSAVMESTLVLDTGNLDRLFMGARGSAAVAEREQLGLVNSAKAHAVYDPEEIEDYIEEGRRLLHRLSFPMASRRW